MKRSKQATAATGYAATTPATPGEAALTPDELSAVSRQIDDEFPLDSPEPGLVLMDLDPFRLHAYWGLPAHRLERARADFGGAHQGVHLVLRFREIGTAPARGLPVPLPKAFDREIDGPSGGLDIGLAGDGRTYEAELGLTAADGGWLSLASSNRVTLPPAAATADLVRTSLDLARQGRPGVAAPASPPRPLPTAAVAPPGAASEPLDPSLRGGPPDTLVPEFPNPLPSAAAGVPALQRVRPELPARQQAGAVLLPPPMLAGLRERLSSSALGQREVLLELHAELHLSGKARPGSELELLGRRVTLAPDGSFELRQPIGIDLTDPSVQPPAPEEG